MDLITSHLNADFDSLASAVAALKLYPDAVIVFPGSMEKRVRDFIEVFHPAEVRKVKDLDIGKITRLIVVDTKHPDRIGPLKELLERPDIIVHIYDHHPVTRDDIKGAVKVLDSVGAASTIFAEIIQKRRLSITPMEATLLCLGIYEETGSLLFTSTTAKDLEAVAFLLKRGANLNIVADFLKEEMSREEVALLNELIQSLKEIVIHGVRIRLGRATMEGFGDVSYLAHKIMDMEDLDMDALVLSIGMADKILLVARSKVPELNVARVLAEFGGGGHATASSATIKDLPFEIVEERLLDALHNHIRPLKLAADVMTTPVITIPWDSRVKEAEDMMTRYGVNVLPVLRETAYSGIITREVVEKALFHGFGKSRCIDFATTDAITVAPDSSINEIEKAMIEHNQRFIAVMEGNRIVGAITRTDLLRSLYEDVLRKSRITPERAVSAEAFGRNLSAMLRERLPSSLHEFLVTAGMAAEELGFIAYLVGGCVRDLLRREENLDIDIVVEGDGIAFARHLGEMIGGKVTVHQAFGTAAVRKGDFKLDIAMARTEYYESPAALPKVETSSLKRDLYRRDFTINTLAVKLNPRDFGLLIDFFGGQRDLKDRVIRVLHNLSFVEDPTRAFRAIRFSERFGFKLTKHTENLLKLAVRMNIFDKLAGTRLYDELVLTFHETDPIKSIRRLGDYQLLGVIHPRLAFTAEVEELLRSVHDTLTWFDLLFLEEKYDKGLIYTMALLHVLNADEREAAMNRLSVSEKIRERVLEGLAAAARISRTLIAGNPVMVYHLLHGCDIEAILLGMAALHDPDRKKAVSHYLVELRTVRPLIRGNDLKALGIQPGPAYTKIFAEVLNEKLMKRLATKEEEIEFVKRVKELKS